MNNEHEELLTVSDVARLFKVRPSWVYERCRKGVIHPLPHLKLGKYLRFSKSALITYMNQFQQGDSTRESHQS